MVEITLAQFQVATGADAEHADIYYDAALQAMERFEVSDVTKAVAFLATVGIESEHLTRMQEDLYYTHADRLVAVFPSHFHTAEDAQPYVGKPKALSMLLYNGFHGRGGIQLTWEKNYQIHGDILGLDLVHNPDQLLEPEGAMLVAGSYWHLTKCNDVADNMDEVTLRVNGKRRLALAQRIALRDTGLQAFA